MARTEAVPVILMETNTHGQRRLPIGEMAGRINEILGQPGVKYLGHEAMSAPIDHLPETPGGSGSSVPVILLFVERHRSWKRFFRL